MLLVVLDHVLMEAQYPELDVKLYAFQWAIPTEEPTPSPVDTF